MPMNAEAFHPVTEAGSRPFSTTIGLWAFFWQWTRMPGDIVFAIGALLMA